ncbi:hypothetical protein RDI58_017125 [Solanum bulbocastanum]|uniref:Xylanase inhibitor N-terminal domain-containing protein n=1 Tax=Solanum bulbocastanum TaxID=147425 RepID=A0AAN8Y9N8_SOLBU
MWTCDANRCYKQKQPLYYSTTSKTFRKIDCFRRPSSCMTRDPTLHCDQISHECIYDLNYTDGSRTRGILADDVITFVLDHRPIRVTFGCARDQMGQQKLELLALDVVWAHERWVHILYHLNLE